MRLFTFRFVKDILWILVFSLTLYVLTHNDFINPQVVPATGVYTIQLRQYPLALGMAGHNYIVLKDEDGRVLRELHGLATDMSTQRWKSVGIVPTDKLQVWEFSDPEDFMTESNYSGTILYRGEEKETLSIWNKTDQCKEKINEMMLSYPPLGIKIGGSTINSNSVAYTLGICMGLHMGHIGLFTPGWGKNLLDSN